MNRQHDENKGLRAAPGPASGTMPAPGSGPRRIEIADLLGACREAVLVHNGEAYRLRLTANNKLILTK